MAKRLPPLVRLPKYQGKSAAFRRFVRQLMNTHMLLDIGLVGLEDRLATADGAIQKMESFHGVPGPLPKNYKPTWGSRA